MSKKIIVIACVALAAIGLFAGGFFCGLNFFSWNYNISTLTEARIGIMPLISNIEALDRNDYDALRTSLNMRLDTEIIRIYNTIDKTKNKEDIDKAKKSLSHLAKHRQKFPAAYPKYPTDPETEKIYKRVGAILAEFADFK